MVDKKGFLRILEALIAIILLLGLIFYLTPKKMKDEGKVPRNVEEMQQFILKEVSYNTSFRDCVLNSEGGSCRVSFGCRADVNRFIKNNIPNTFDYQCEICKTSVSCMSETLPLDKSIYADSSLIGAENSKVFRVYMWSK